MGAKPSWFVRRYYCACVKNLSIIIQHSYDRKQCTYIYFIDRYFFSFEACYYHQLHDLWALDDVKWFFCAIYLRKRKYVFLANQIGQTRILLRIVTNRCKIRLSDRTLWSWCTKLMVIRKTKFIYWMLVANYCNALLLYCYESLAHTVHCDTSPTYIFDGICSRHLLHTNYTGYDLYF